MGNRESLLAVSICVSFALSLFVERVQAQGAPTLDEVRTQLASADAAQIQTGLESAGLLGTPNVVPLVVERVRQGLRADLLAAALDTLAALGQPTAGPVLFDLLSHRRPEVRRKAVGVIVICKPSGAEGALASALGDEDDEVRRLAVAGLGALSAKHSVRTLFLALDRGITEAAVSIADLGNAAEVTQLMGYLGKVPLTAMSDAMTHVLSRTDLPVSAKLATVTRLEELATGEVRELLQTFGQSKAGGTGNEPVRRAAMAAAGRIAK